MTAPLLEVTGLVKHFPIRSGLVLQRQVGAVQAVDDISFTVGAGEPPGVVGASGCGKATTGPLGGRRPARGIQRIHPAGAPGRDHRYRRFGRHATAHAPDSGPR